MGEGGVYDIRKVSLDDDWPGFLRDFGLGEGAAYILRPGVIFSQAKPQRVASVEQLRTFTPPPPQKAPRKWMMVVTGNNGVPLGPDTPLPEPAMYEMMKSTRLFAIEQAHSDFSKKTQMARWSGPSLLLILGGALVLVLAIAIIAVHSALSKPDQAGQPAQTAQTAQTGQTAQQPVEQLQVEELQGGN